MAGLFLGVLAPPVRCVAIIERAGRTGLDLPARTRPRCGQLCIARRAGHPGLQRFIRHIILDLLRTRAAARARAACRTGGRSDSSRAHRRSGIRQELRAPVTLEVMFRKLTGRPRVPPNRSPKLPPQPAGQTGDGPLSNPPETINLAPDSRTGNRAGRGSPQRRSLRLRRSGGGPIFKVPIRFMDRTGSGDLEKCVAGCFVMAHA